MICSVLESIPILSVTGYFDENTAAVIDQKATEFLKAGKLSLIFDLSNCTAINSLAVGMLQHLTMLIVEDFQGHLVIATLQPIMIKVFELAMITPYASITSTNEKALSLIKTSA